MEKLKTLKDFNTWEMEEHTREYTFDLIKEEAIKWVKHIQDEWDSEIEVGGVGAISEFFNLTEEDLK